MASLTQTVVLNSVINNKLQHQQNCSKAFHTAVALFTQNMINRGREKSLGNRKKFVEAQNCGTQVKTCMESLTGAWLCRNNESSVHFNVALSHNLFSESFHFSVKTFSISANVTDVMELFSKCSDTLKPFFGK